MAEGKDIGIAVLMGCLGGREMTVPRFMWVVEVSKTGQRRPGRGKKGRKGRRSRSDSSVPLGEGDGDQTDSNIVS